MAKPTIDLNPNAPQKILIIGPSWVGDMVMAQSLFIKLKQLHPNVQIDVLAPSWSRPLLERMPEIKTAIDMPLGHGQWGLKARRALAKQLQGYDQAITLPNSWKSALIPWFADIPLRTGWLGEIRYGLLNDHRKLDKEAMPLMVQRFVALAFPQSRVESTYIAKEQCPTPKLTVQRQKQIALLDKFRLQTHKPVLILCPGAEFGPAKQWPIKHYAATAEAAISRGFQTWIMGSSSDQKTSQQIENLISQGDNVTSLCGKTTLEEAIDLMNLADQVITNDSGLMHIACALDKPVIALYGATSPEFTPPLSDKATILSIPIDCGPCFKRECPLQHHRCMEELLPEKVNKLLDLD